MPALEPPKRAQVLVVGGGPAGSYAAAALAREGFNVVLFEMSKFPRYHIGESLIPSVRHYLRFIGAEEKLASYGFTRKPGSAVKFNQYMREGYTDFVALGAENNAWNVVRAEFDQLLLQHAAACGTRVCEQTRVTTLRFARDEAGSADELGRPVAACYETALGGRGEIGFDYLVDATGRAGLMSTKYLKNRKFNESLKNVAVWGYWRNTRMYGEGTERENAPWFEALSDESGWAWFIPLHKGLTSVGVVMGQKELGIRSRAASSASSTPFTPTSTPRHRPPLAKKNSSNLADRYLSFLQLAPGVLELIGDGELVRVQSEEDPDEDAPVARSASDYSYSADRYAGPGYRIVGDAGAFIDPFFSSGVHLAMTGALSAAASIAASIRGDCTEMEAARWHSSRVSVSYTRFLVVVLSAYKQIRSQSANALADIEEESFDRAFAFLRPVIQGSAEMGKKLCEDEVQRALDFCVHLFDPTTPEQHEVVRQKLIAFCHFQEDDAVSPFAGDGTTHIAGEAGSHTREDPARLLDVHSPIIDPTKLEKLLRQHLHVRCPSPRSQLPSERQRAVESEVKMVLDKVNARRVIHAEHGNGLNSLEQETLDGFVVRLKRGHLGLQKISR
ncbi:FAD/NAD(P)-binding domain-containing protein [Obba rivulosa]|uniref:FAD/NAD(P)-binding domain-containing protein n=1 Tax=Obba rivulosa TaxID=1052685 RepID=A0A8E2B150_9APHY|nr:FAD/NAD(P)-binding domain-containing protein [Obba rivulosa]